MRHAVRGRKLARTSAHRLALRRNLVQSLIEHGEIRTTLVKAKEVRAFGERIITLAIDGSLAARQRAEALLNDRAIIPKANQEEYDRMSDAKREKVLFARSGRRHRRGEPRPGQKFTADSVMHRLFAEVGPKMKQRNESRGAGGGYIRIIPLGERRLGDAGALAILRIVSPDDKPRPRLSKNKTARRRKAAVRYALYAGKPAQPRGGRRSAAAKSPKASKASKASGAAKPAGDAAAPTPD